ncbi:hypothetical protein BJ085DRAFT_28901 [Dimargaris cristalligena]|uniref:Uncharacterized protein n=1 Tax=Dimargaris cristalligena TaxID=215637 RepID=A0A4V1J5Q7_9FUNG|nr:hypothetical protein BJ085DRAFT_28901 [Dimargaris cristalligena]|eukprot:RKP39899.1 hypothetical protein BJ085DRAFT_28901 [Dimargaris cristalligena]
MSTEGIRDPHSPVSPILARPSTSQGSASGSGGGVSGGGGGVTATGYPRAGTVTNQRRQSLLSDCAESISDMSLNAPPANDSNPSLQHHPQLPSRRVSLGRDSIPPWEMDSFDQDTAEFQRILDSQTPLRLPKAGTVKPPTSIATRRRMDPPHQPLVERGDPSPNQVVHQSPASIGPAGPSRMAQPATGPSATTVGSGGDLGHFRRLRQSYNFMADSIALNVGGGPPLAVPTTRSPSEQSTRALYSHSPREPTSPFVNPADQQGQGAKEIVESGKSGNGKGDIFKAASVPIHPTAQLYYKPNSANRNRAGSIAQGDNGIRRFRSRPLAPTHVHSHEETEGEEEDDEADSQDEADTRSRVPAPIPSRSNGYWSRGGNKGNNPSSPKPNIAPYPANTTATNIPSYGTAHGRFSLSDPPGSPNYHQFKAELPSAPPKFGPHPTASPIATVQHQSVTVGQSIAGFHPSSGGGSPGPLYGPTPLVSALRGYTLDSPYPSATTNGRLTEGHRKTSSQPTHNVVITPDMEDNDSLLFAMSGSSLNESNF